MSALSFPVTAQAQFEKGKWIVNPSVTGLGLSYSKSEKTQFGLQAQGGAFLVDNVALMLTAGANWSKPEDKVHTGCGWKILFRQMRHLSRSRIEDESL